MVWKQKWIWVIQQEHRNAWIRGFREVKKPKLFSWLKKKTLNLQFFQVKLYFNFSFFTFGKKITMSSWEDIVASKRRKRNKKFLFIFQNIFCSLWRSIFLSQNEVGFKTTKKTVLVRKKSKIWRRKTERKLVAKIKAQKMATEIYNRWNVWRRLNLTSKTKINGFLLTINSYRSKNNKVITFCHLHNITNGKLLLEYFLIINLPFWLSEIAHQNRRKYQFTLKLC